MFFQIKMQSDIPIYQQIHDQIILALAKKELNPADQLPSVRQLADELGVNMMTVSKGYNQLKDEGYLITNRQQGTVINTLPMVNERFTIQLKTQLQLLVATAKARGLSEAQVIKLCQQLYQELEGE